jgi:hypothetical protein
LREFEFTFPDGNKRPARHRVRIFENPLGWTTIICTDRSVKFKCASITNSIDHLITELVAQEKLNPMRLVIIEHYDDIDKESWDLVKFDQRRDGSFAYPKWEAISKEEARRWAGLEPKGDKAA